jgi:ABC-2 type transport system ATP-binding protein
VLWATHILEEIAPGDFVYVLHEGRIVAEAPAEELASAAGATLDHAFRRLTGPQEAAP